MKILNITLLFLCVNLNSLHAQKVNWYTQGNFKPIKRLEITLKNTLEIERVNCPIVIPRQEFPYPDVHEMWVTIVDPSLPSAVAPSKELLAVQGGHQLRKETNGHVVFHQLDDLDQDGIWDELFFQTNLKPNEEKTLYVYFGENIRGWNKHYTHVNIGSYCRHQMPFWESENVGWKIWFANSVDVYGKRKPELISHKLYMENLDGYGVSKLNYDYGSDLQLVAETFGGGAICLFEHADKPEIASRPRFTPKQGELDFNSLWNAGQISDTRYAYIPVVNGPLRSIIKIKTMNWNTADGSYEVEQHYTVYAHQNYCRSQVLFKKFNPTKSGVKMGCGIRKKPGEEDLVLDNGIIISSGPEGIKDPEKIDDRQDVMVDFMGKAIVVKDEYNPEYQFVEDKKGNHVFRLTPDANNYYEYMLFAAWSEGAVLNTQESFEKYVSNTALEYSNPVEFKFAEMQSKL